MGRFWKIQRGGESYENPFHGWGMDIFWNHTLNFQCTAILNFYDVIWLPLLLRSNFFVCNNMVNSMTS